MCLQSHLFILLYIKWIIVKYIPKIQNYFFFVHMKQKEKEREMNKDKLKCKKVKSVFLKKKFIIWLLDLKTAP